MKAPIAIGGRNEELRIKKLKNEKGTEDGSWKMEDARPPWRVNRN
jgi:hypothetical protein